MNIHVSNLSLNIIDSDLRKLFSSFGEVDSAVIVRDKWNGRSRGTALVDMVNDVSSLTFSECWKVRVGVYRIELDESIWYSKRRLNL